MLLFTQSAFWMLFGVLASFVLVQTSVPPQELLVAAVDAPQSVKNAATVVANGVDDHLVIALAMASLPDGGTVRLSEGHFNVEPLRMRSRIALVGEGMGRTILTLQSGSAKPWAIGIISQREVSISNLTVDVNGQRQRDQVVEGVRGIEVSYNSTLVNLDAVEVTNAGGQSVKVFGSNLVTVQNCRSSWAGWDGNGGIQEAIGIEVGATGWTTTNVSIINCEVNHNSGIGISIRAGSVAPTKPGRTESVVIAGNRVHNNDRINYSKGAITLIAQPYYKDISIVDNDIQLSAETFLGYGIQLQPAGATNILVAGNRIRTAQPTHYALMGQDVVGETATNIFVAGNRAEGPGGILMLSPSTPMSVSNNDFRLMSNPVMLLQPPVSANFRFIGNQMPR